jgi:hypothetical protein
LLDGLGQLLSVVGGAVDFCESNLLALSSNEVIGCSSDESEQANTAKDDSDDKAGAHLLGVLFGVQVQKNVILLQGMSLGNMIPMVLSVLIMELVVTLSFFNDFGVNLPEMNEISHISSINIDPRGHVFSSHFNSDIGITEFLFSQFNSFNGLLREEAVATVSLHEAKKNTINVW